MDKIYIQNNFDGNTVDVLDLDLEDCDSVIDLDRSSDNNDDERDDNSNLDLYRMGKDAVKVTKGSLTVNVDKTFQSSCRNVVAKLNKLPKSRYKATPGSSFVMVCDEEAFERPVVNEETITLSDSDDDMVIVDPAPSAPVQCEPTNDKQIVMLNGKDTRVMPSTRSVIANEKAVYINSMPDVNVNKVSSTTDLNTPHYASRYPDKIETGVSMDKDHGSLMVRACQPSSTRHDTLAGHSNDENIFLPNPIDFTMPNTTHTPRAVATINATSTNSIFGYSQFNVCSNAVDPLSSKGNENFTNSASSKHTLNFFSRNGHEQRETAGIETSRVERILTNQCDLRDKRSFARRQKTIAQANILPSGNNEHGVRSSSTWTAIQGTLHPISKRHIPQVTHSTNRPVMAIQPSLLQQGVPQQNISQGLSQQCFPQECCSQQCCSKQCPLQDGLSQKCLSQHGLSQWGQSQQIYQRDNNPPHKLQQQIHPKHIYPAHTYGLSISQPQHSLQLQSKSQQTNVAPDTMSGGHGASMCVTSTVNISSQSAFVPHSIACSPSYNSHLVMQNSSCINDDQNTFNLIPEQDVCNFGNRQPYVSQCIVPSRQVTPTVQMPESLQYRLSMNGDRLPTSAAASRVRPGVNFDDLLTERAAQAGDLTNYRQLSKPGISLIKPTSGEFNRLQTSTIPLAVAKQPVVDEPVVSVHQALNSGASLVEQTSEELHRLQTSKISLTLVKEPIVATRQISKSGTSLDERTSKELHRLQTSKTSLILVKEPVVATRQISKSSTSLDEQTSEELHRLPTPTIPVTLVKEAVVTTRQMSKSSTSLDEQTSGKLHRLPTPTIPVTLVKEAVVTTRQMSKSSTSLDERTSEELHGLQTSTLPVTLVKGDEQMVTKPVTENNQKQGVARKRTLQNRSHTSKIQRPAENYAGLSMDFMKSPTIPRSVESSQTKAAVTTTPMITRQTVKSDVTSPASTIGVDSSALYIDRVKCDGPVADRNPRVEGEQAEIASGESGGSSMSDLSAKHKHSYSEAADHMQLRTKAKRPSPDKKLSVSHQTFTATKKQEVMEFAFLCSNELASEKFGIDLEIIVGWNDIDVMPLLDVKLLQNNEVDIDEEVNTHLSAVKKKGIPLSISALTKLASEIAVNIHGVRSKDVYCKWATKFISRHQILVQASILPERPSSAEQTTDTEANRCQVEFVERMELAIAQRNLAKANGLTEFHKRMINLYGFVYGCEAAAKAFSVADRSPSVWRQEDIASLLDFAVIGIDSSSEIDYKVSKWLITMRQRKGEISFRTLSNFARGVSKSYHAGDHSKEFEKWAINFLSAHNIDEKLRLLDEKMAPVSDGNQSDNSEVQEREKSKSPDSSGDQNEIEGNCESHGTRERAFGSAFEQTIILSSEERSILKRLANMAVKYKKHGIPKENGCYTTESSRDIVEYSFIYKKLGAMRKLDVPLSVITAMLKVNVIPLLKPSVLRLETCCIVEAQVNKWLQENCFGKNRYVSLGAVQLHVHRAFAAANLKHMVIPWSVRFFNMHNIRGKLNFEKSSTSMACSKNTQAEKLKVQVKEHHQQGNVPALRKSHSGQTLDHGKKTGCDYDQIEKSKLAPVNISGKSMPIEKTMTIDLLRIDSVQCIRKALSEKHCYDVSSNECNKCSFVCVCLPQPIMRVDNGADVEKSEKILHTPSPTRKSLRNTEPSIVRKKLELKRKENSRKFHIEKNRASKEADDVSDSRTKENEAMYNDTCHEKQQHSTQCAESIYSETFKKKAVFLAFTFNIDFAAKELCVPFQTIHQWMSRPVPLIGEDFLRGKGQRSSQGTIEDDLHDWLRNEQNRNVDVTFNCLSDYARNYIRKVDPENVQLRYESWVKNLLRHIQSSVEKTSNNQTVAVSRVPSYTKNLKLEVVEYCCLHGMNKAVETFSIPPTTVYNWLSKITLTPLFLLKQSRIKSFPQLLQDWLEPRLRQNSRIHLGLFITSARRLLKNRLQYCKWVCAFLRDFDILNFANQMFITRNESVVTDSPNHEAVAAMERAESEVPIVHGSTDDGTKVIIDRDYFGTLNTHEIVDTSTSLGDTDISASSYTETDNLQECAKDKTLQDCGYKIRKSSQNNESLYGQQKPREVESRKNIHIHAPGANSFKEVAKHEVNIEEYKLQESSIMLDNAYSITADDKGYVLVDAMLYGIDEAASVHKIPCDLLRLWMNYDISCTICLTKSVGEECEDHKKIRLWVDKQVENKQAFTLMTLCHRAVELLSGDQNQTLESVQRFTRWVSKLAHCDIGKWINPVTDSFELSYNKMSALQTPTSDELKSLIPDHVPSEHSDSGSQSRGMAVVGADESVSNGEVVSPSCSSTSKKLDRVSDHIDEPDKPLVNRDGILPQSGREFPLKSDVCLGQLNASDKQNSSCDVKDLDRGEELYQLVDTHNCSKYPDTTLSLEKCVERHRYLKVVLEDCRADTFSSKGTMNVVKSNMIGHPSQRDVSVKNEWNSGIFETDVTDCRDDAFGYGDTLAVDSDVKREDADCFGVMSDCELRGNNNRGAKKCDELATDATSKQVINKATDAESQEMSDEYLEDLTCNEQKTNDLACVEQCLSAVLDVLVATSGEIHTFADVSYRDEIVSDVSHSGQDLDRVKWKMAAKPNNAAQQPIIEDVEIKAEFTEPLIKQQPKLTEINKYYSHDVGLTNAISEDSVVDCVNEGYDSNFIQVQQSLTGLVESVTKLNETSCEQIVNDDIPHKENITPADSTEELYSFVTSDISMTPEHVVDTWHGIDLYEEILEDDNEFNMIVCEIPQAVNVEELSSPNVS